MKQILKRLELIKTSIAIEDEEIIELQIIKLYKLPIDNEVKSIIQKLENIDYGNVVVEIENYITKYSGVVIYEDNEIQALKLELKALERKLQELSELKTEYNNDIEDFNNQHNLRFGAIIREILNIKQRIQYFVIKKQREIFQEIKEEYKKAKEEYQKTKTKKDKLEDELEDMDEFDDDYDELYEEYQNIKDECDELEDELNDKRQKTKKAKKEFEEDETTKTYKEYKQSYEDFNQEYENIKKEEKNKFNLDEEEKKELKKLYRKASKLCHPDIVIDKLKEKANEIMQELNSAYAKKDLKVVKEILLNLESGLSFAVTSDEVDDKEILKAKIVEFRDSINKIEENIEDLQNSNIYKTINDFDDIDEYFSEIEVIYNEQLDFLRDKLNGLIEKEQEKRETSEDIKKDIFDEEDYWNSEF